jgi:aspartate aminotransferase-like enzyme
MKFNYSVFEFPKADPVALKAIMDEPSPFTPPSPTVASLNEAIQKIRASQPTLVVSHEDYDQIVSAGLPAKVQSSILVDPGQAYVFRSAA